MEWVGRDLKGHLIPFFPTLPIKYIYTHTERERNTHRNVVFWRNAKQNPNLISTIVRTYLALPTTTVCAQGCMISMNEPWSKNPLSHCPF